MKLLLTFALAATLFAETHRFEPKEFYNTFSGASCTGASYQAWRPRGYVTRSTRAVLTPRACSAARGPNPETGPFYIEGAEPGDTLVVHLLRLETNRATGFSASLLAPYTADPGLLTPGSAARAEDGDLADR